MNVMTVSPVTPEPMKQNEEQRVAGEGVDIPRQSEAEPNAEPHGEGSPDGSAETEPVGEAGEEKEGSNEDKEEKDEKKAASKPKRKSAPRKAAGTKMLVVLKEGRVRYADADTVLVVDLDEASSPDTDVHDVLDRL